MPTRRGNVLSFRASEAEKASLARIHRYLARCRFPTIPTQTDAVFFAIGKIADAIERRHKKRKQSHGKAL